MARIVSQGSGKTPAVYQLEEHGEHYMLGSEVGYALQFYKGALYKRFPSLYRRVLTLEERQILCNLNVGIRTLANLGTMVVKASEAKEILNGKGETYKQKNTLVAKQNNKNKIAINIAFCRKSSENLHSQDDCTYIPSACGKVLKKISSKQNAKFSFLKVKNDPVDSTQDVELFAAEMVSLTTLPNSYERKKLRSKEISKQVFKVK